MKLWKSCKDYAEKNKGVIKIIWMSNFWIIQLTIQYTYNIYNNQLSILLL